MKKIVLLFLLLTFVFSAKSRGVGDPSAQPITNIKIEYSCPCKVTVTYDLEADEAVHVKLYYSSDTLAYGWLLAATFPGKTTGSHIDIWDCNAAGVLYGQFYFKLEAKLPECVWINGVCWATRNVNMPGDFAAHPEDAGMFYQWNRNVGWSSLDPMENSNGSTTWDSSIPLGNTWAKINDPCPTGWRVPTYGEQENLMYSDNYWDALNGVPGRFFGQGTQKVFFPATGYRNQVGGTLYNMDTNGYSWCSAPYGSEHAFCLFLNYGVIFVGGIERAHGFTVRCVLE